MIKVRELKGYKSLRALNGFNALLLGLKMLPAHANEPYEEFFEKIQSLPEDAQEKLMREAVHFVQIQPDELEAMVCFCEDANGVAYSSENVKNLSAEELVNIVVAVAMKIGQMKISLVSDSEKKKSQISALI